MKRSSSNIPLINFSSPLSALLRHKASAGCYTEPGELLQRGIAAIGAMLSSTSLFSKMRSVLFICGWLLCVSLHAQIISTPQIISAGNGWANNSINTVVFRKNSLCTYKNTQYIAYYNNDGNVVLGKRKLNRQRWQLVTTSLKGKVTDAHNSISIITDGDGFLHMTWNHHNNKLHYCKSVAPGSLQMTEELSMTGRLEEKVTYPEFHTLPHGNLLFFYRDGQSGQGNLVVNCYNTKQKKWQQLHKNLIDGEGKRNAYWQACVDAKGTIHISWVWRESADVASNHDLCYAKSDDGGVTWMNSKNERYALPITAAIAEYACHIPQKSELINQTSMCADEEGNPFIASYWKEKNDSVPQYHVVYHNGHAWQTNNLGFRKTAFSLSGTGTKRIPASRPQIITWKKGNKQSVMLVYRDEESGSKVSAALCSNFNTSRWTLHHLSERQVGSWEPCYDTELWRRKKRLELFVQYTEQADSEGKAIIPPQPVQIISVKPK